MTDAFIEKTLEQGVLWLTLNNAEQRNPLSSAMLADITSSLETAYEYNEVRCIVIAARGPVFSAGHDLTEMARRSDETSEAWKRRVMDILEACATMFRL